MPKYFAVIQSFCWGIRLLLIHSNSRISGGLLFILLATSVLPAGNAAAKCGLWFSPGFTKPVQIEKTRLLCAQWEGTAAWLARHRAEQFDAPLFWALPVRAEFSSVSLYRGGLPRAADAYASPVFQSVPQSRSCRASVPVEVLNAFDYYEGGERLPKTSPKAYFADADTTELSAVVSFRQWRAGAYVKDVLAHLKFNDVDLPRDVRKRLQEWESAGYGLALVKYEPVGGQDASAGWLPAVQFDFAVSLDLRENWFLLETDQYNEARLETCFLFGGKRAEPKGLHFVHFPSDYFLPAESANIFPDLAQELRKNIWRKQKSFAACLFRAGDLSPVRWTPSELSEENARYKLLMDSLSAFAGGARWLPEELQFSCWIFGGKLAEPRGLKITTTEYRPPFRARFYYREPLRLPDDAPMRDRCARKAAYEAKVAQENLIRLAGWNGRRSKGR